MLWLRPSFVPSVVVSSGSETVGRRAKSFDFMVTLVFVRAERLLLLLLMRLGATSRKPSALLCTPPEGGGGAISAQSQGNPLTPTPTRSIYRTLTENSPFEVESVAFTRELIMSAATLATV